MYLTHAVLKEYWKQYEGKKWYGEDYLNDEDGFIHCSEVSTQFFPAKFWKDDKRERVILVIDADKVKSGIKMEDTVNCGMLFPHIYGLLNLDAVVEVVEYLCDEQGNWICNEELKKYDNRNLKD